MINIGRHDFNNVNYLQFRNEIDSLIRHIPEAPRIIPLRYPKTMVRIKIGGIVQDFELESGDRTRKMLYEFTDSLRLLVFWVGAGKNTSSFLEIMYKLNEEKNIVMLISPESMSSIWKPEEQYFKPSQYYHCHLEVPQRMGISYYPTMLLVDSEFRVIARWEGYPEGVEELRDWIESKTQRN